jgi:nucleoside transporter
MPNLGLSNTICLKHLIDSERDYPIVRVFATLGWIVAGWIVSLLFMAEESPVQFYTAAVAAWGVGIYSFFLPRTPPPGKGAPLKLGELYGSGTWRYFKKRAFAIFMVASLLASMGMMPYWGMGSPFVNFLGIERSGAFFTMGQMAELVVLAVILPVFIKRFGIKWTMGIGLLCWVLRFVLFSEAATSSGGSMMALLVIAVLLHGFSYDFVFVSGYLYVDKHVGEEVRAQAQGLLVVFTQGIGFFLSSQLLVGHLGSRYGVPGDDAGSWQSYWLVPAMFMAGVLVLFWFAFREEKRTD